MASSNPIVSSPNQSLNPKTLHKAFDSFANQAKYLAKFCFLRDLTAPQFSKQV